jgi:P27 family predicted phage terminase small subunit
MSGELYAMRLLTPLDVAVFAAYCEAYATWRTAAEALSRMEAQDPLFRGLLVRGPDGNAAANPFVSIERRAARNMVRFAGEFGMVPSARARIAAGPFRPVA